MDYRDLIGVPFVTHGRTIEEGFDCYGLAIEVLKRNGIYLPDMFYENLHNRKDTVDKLYKAIHSVRCDKPQELCIILINENGIPAHVGVYIGEGMFIHTTQATGVIIEPLRRWIPRVEGYYKVIN